MSYRETLINARAKRDSAGAEAVIKVFEARIEELKEASIGQPDEIVKAMHGAIVEIRKVIGDIRRTERERPPSGSYK